MNEGRPRSYETEITQLFLLICEKQAISYAQINFLTQPFACCYGQIVIQITAFTHLPATPSDPVKCLWLRYIVVA